MKALFRVKKKMEASSDEWIKMWYIQTMEYYSPIKVIKN